MLFLIAFVGAAVIALVLWKAMNTVRGEIPQEPVRRSPTGVTRTRVSGPDDDPDFLRQLDERVRKPEDPPAS
ncbi:hypothetical protein [Pseudonocardia sp. GCM10023141]|uniref:hypothetical protein n=1 Tax=Pseudonocardia sp. GCM10023141 TaxID=3252653 RepID=UPI00361D27AC